jgi:hypothetical protein
MWYIYGIHMVYSAIHILYMVYIRYTYGIHMVYIWYTYGIHMVYISRYYDTHIQVSQYPRGEAQLQQIPALPLDSLQVLLDRIEDTESAESAVSSHTPILSHIPILYTPVLSHIPIIYTPIISHIPIIYAPILSHTPLPPLSCSALAVCCRCGQVLV